MTILIGGNSCKHQRQLCSSAGLASAQSVQIPPELTNQGRTYGRGENYNWEWSGESDRFRFIDKQGRVM